MKDMSIIANKKIINKETNEVRLVVSIDEENRKIHSVPVDEPNAEPSIMAAASYDRRWKLYDEAVNETTETTETEVNHDEPMKMSDVVTKLESLFDILNRVYFDNALPKPVITVQSTPKAYGHCSTKKIWKSESDGQYEINIGAEFLNRPSANTAATMCHEMVHLYCLVNEIQDTCQKGRYHNNFTGLLSEVKVYDPNKKQPWQWKKIPGHERNEALDCRNYALAAFKALPKNLDEIDRRLKEAGGERAPAPVATPVMPPPAAKQRPKRRSGKKYYDDW